jgi:energy-coupling factor transport system permease protein
MSWSAEDSIEAADSMRARGYHSGGTRTSYNAFRFTRRDFAGLDALLLLFVASLVLLVMYAKNPTFYPILRGFWLPDVVYLPYGLLMGFALLIEGGEQLRWLKHSLDARFS